MNSDSFLYRPYDFDDDEADDFLFGSIQTYDTLQMFTLENIPLHLLQTDDTSLCVASKRNKGENSEVLKLKLPEKLMLPAEEEGRCKENDFKVLSGIYTENQIYEIDQFDDKLITSESNATGLNIYSFNDSSLGVQNQQKKLNVVPWTESEFSMIWGTAQAVCSKCCHEPLMIIDLSTGGVVKEFEHSFQSSKNPSNGVDKKADKCCIKNIKCHALSSDLIAVLNTVSGEVALHDLRSEGSFVQLTGNTKKLNEEIWTISGYDYKGPCLNYFGVLSNATSFCIYDKRKTSVLTQSTGDNIPSSDHNMKLKFNKSDKFSVSGMNSFVQIFRLNGVDFEHVFTHTGHSPGKLTSDLVTDHIWLQAGGKEYIVSICSNRTLNCWDFKA